MFLRPTLLLGALLATLATAGCGDRKDLSTEGADPGQDTLLRSYLIGEIGAANFGGRVFCAYEPLGSQERGDTLARYLWVYCQEYYPAPDSLPEGKGGRLEQGTGSSLPVAVYIRRDGRSVRIVGHRVPQDGAGYAPSVREIFPPEIGEKILARRESRGLAEQTEAAARAHFMTP